MWSSSPRLPSSLVPKGEVAVANAQLMSSIGFRCSKGCSRLWPSPEPYPSCVMPKLCTRTRCDMVCSLESGRNWYRPAADFHTIVDFDARDSTMPWMSFEYEEKRNGNHSNRSVHDA